MTDLLYARPYYTAAGKTVYGEIDSYSVLQYAMEQTGKTGYVPNASLASTLEWLLSEGAKAQIAENYKTDCLPTGDFGYLLVEGALLPDGVSQNGGFAVGSEVTLTGIGGVMGWYQDGARVGSGHTLAVTVTAEPQCYTAVCEEHDYEAVLVSPATCTESAIYRLVCACGEPSGEPYASGDALGHDTENGVCRICGQLIASEGLTFESNGDGTCALTDIGTCTDTEVVVPDQSPDGDTVTSIGSSAFKGEEIEYINLPYTLIEIGDNAFKNCNSLTNVFFRGAPEEWYEIVISETGNGKLTGATIDFAEMHTRHIEVIDAAVDATCTGTGLTAGSRCAICDAILVAQEVTPALGHDYEDVVTAPTCTTAGYTTHTCSRCGDSYTDSETATTGHNYNSRTGFCAYCGESNVIYESNGDGTCKVTGLRSKTYDDVYVVIAEETPNGDRVTSIAENAFVGSYVEEVLIPKTVTTIKANAFYDVPIMAVYFGGSRALWDSITFEEGNGAVYFADVYYYSTTKPAADGMLWHWVNDVLTVWPPNTDDYGELHPSH